MEFFVILFIVCFFIFVFFIFKAKPENNVQQNMAATMSGSIPVVNNQPEPSDDDEVLARAHRLAQLAEAYCQARIVHDDDAVARLDAGDYDGPLPEQRGDGGWLSVYDGLRILPIAGINHRKGIGAYTGKCECALVPEPTNEFDPEAIKIVAEDGHHLGYVAQHHTQMVRSWASHRFPCYATAIINQHADELDGHTFYTGFIYVLINK